MCDPALRGSLALGLLARLRSLRWLPAAPLRPGVGGIAASERIGSFAIYVNKSGVENGQAVFLLSVRRLSCLILSDVIKGMKADCNSL